MRGFAMHQIREASRERRNRRGALRSRRILGLAAVVGIFAGCIESGVDPDDQRPCETEAGNSNWEDFGFQAEVTQPEICPIGLDIPGQLLPLNGEVWFPKSTFETGLQSPALAGNEAIVKDNDGVEIFQADLGYSESMDRTEWRATITDSYHAGLAGPVNGGADTLVFRTLVTNSLGFEQEVLGRADLTFTFVPRMTLSGPASASAQQIVELACDVENGSLPMTFEWFHNDVPVKSEVVNSYFSSYSTFGLEFGTHTFDCFATDVDGDTNNKRHTLDSCSGCGDGGF